MVNQLDISISNFHGKRKLVFILLLLFLIFPGVTANNVTFADPDATVHKDILIYYANGTLFTTTNTTSTNVALPTDAEGDFLLVLKPQYTNPLEDPGTWVDNAFSFVETNLVSLIAIMFLTGLLLTRR